MAPISRRRAGSAGGNTWPGRARSSARVWGSTAAKMVCARSYDEIPVVTPLPRASIETVNAVPRFRGVVGHHWSQFQLVKPLAGHGETDQTPCVGSHKIDHSGVIISAAIMRSPSFSRSSSSAMTIIRPDRSSLSDFSIAANSTAWATGQRSSPPDTRATSDETSRSTALGC